jgi:hypothetical protein
MRRIMEIESITAVSPPVALPEVLPHPPAHLSDAEIALAHSQAIARETTEQRAADGDPIAISEVNQRIVQLVPIQSAFLLPADHPAGAHEPGKGEQIDVYD